LNINLFFYNYEIELNSRNISARFSLTGLPNSPPKIIPLYIKTLQKPQGYLWRENFSKFFCDAIEFGQGTRRNGIFKIKRTKLFNDEQSSKAVVVVCSQNQ
jgi:hypothetical protein